MDTAKKNHVFDLFLSVFLVLLVFYALTQVIDKKNEDETFERTKIYMTRIENPENIKVNVNSLSPEIYLTGDMAGQCLYRNPESWGLFQSGCH